MPLVDSVDYGTLTPSFERGSVLLVSGHDAVRVVWTGKKPAHVPAGRWRLHNYRIEGKLEDTEWFISGSAPQGPTIEVKKDEETALEIDETVRLTVKARRMHGQWHLMFNIQGHEDMGLTVVKNDARPTPKWKIARGDAELAGGDYRYG